MRSITIRVTTFPSMMTFTVSGAEADPPPLFGTTYYGGCTFSTQQHRGVIFRLRSGVATTDCLTSFTSDPGTINALTVVNDDTVYGTAAGQTSGGLGIIFKWTKSGGLVTLHSFTGADGAWPFAGLVSGGDGYFYGTTSVGGTINLPGGGTAEGKGVIFRVTPAGSYTVLHTFNGADGSNPHGTLVIQNGYLYGTTMLGGAYGKGEIFRLRKP